MGGGDAGFQVRDEGCVVRVDEGGCFHGGWLEWAGVMRVGFWGFDNGICERDF